jgi:hypothetical protein
LLSRAEWDKYVNRDVERKKLILKSAFKSWLASEEGADVDDLGHNEQRDGRAEARASHFPAYQTICTGLRTKDGD